MFTSLWLRQLRRRVFGCLSIPSRGKSSSAAARRRVRLCLEVLEDRLTPSAEAVQTAAVALSTPFSASQQTVQLSANVTDSTPVNQGVVTFTVEDSNGNPVGSSVQGMVSNGTASANFNLPSEPAGNYTINVSYNDSTGTFTDGGDTSAALTVTPAKVLVAAQNASAATSSSDQTVTLTAHVTDDSFPSQQVSEGTVTFTLKDSNGNVIGSPVPGNVTAGVASVHYTLPANTPTGSYTIAVTYSGSSNFTDDGTDTSGTLTVGTATTTTARNASTTFSPSAQNVGLSATVTSNGSPVTQGKVTFLVVDSSGSTIGSAATATLGSNGSASVSYGLPAFLLAGSYTIEADYSDSSGTFAASSDTTHTLNVVSAPSTIKATSTTVNFNPNDQLVTLNATVTSNGTPVNEGSVSFALFDSNGNTVGSTAAGSVSNGFASANFTLPSGTPAGSYSILATYSDSTHNFASSSDSAQTLTVSTAASTSVSLTSARIVPVLSNATAQITLTAQVSNAVGPVTTGVLSFTFDGVTGQANVVRGTASVQLTVPLSDVAKVSNVILSYQGDASVGNIVGSTTLSTNIWNALLPSNLSFNTQGNEHIAMQLGGQSLFGYDYASSGLLTQIDVQSLALPVTYTDESGGVLVTIAGTPWQWNFTNSQGQTRGMATLALNSDGSGQWIVYDSTGRVIGALPS